MEGLDELFDQWLAMEPGDVETAQHLLDRGALHEKLHFVGSDERV